MTRTDALSATFAALADPTRRAIVARLAEGPATVKELAAPFAMTGPAVSKHLRVLEEAGLVVQGRDAQRRPRRLDPGPIRAVAKWTELYRRFWDDAFDRLDEYLEEIQTDGKGNGKGNGARNRNQDAHAKGATHGRRSKRK